jgi:hypothetical protein
MASQDEANDKTCIFCAEHDEKFDGQGLDLHYWKHCPMLKRCERCKMVVEISGYRNGIFIKNKYFPTKIKNEILFNTLLQNMKKKYFMK